MDYSIFYLILAAFLCLFMTWGVGANDLANVMSTTMGSKAVTVKQAMLIAIVFEFAGAFRGGANSLGSTVSRCAIFISFETSSELR